jgi:hypothetical protein
MNIINPSGNDVKIEDIDKEGTNGLYWYIEYNELPELPYTLPAGDTLSLTVFYMIPVKTTWFYDSLNITTATKTYTETIKVDSLLTTIDNIVETNEVDAKVFPNPFMETVNFDWQRTLDYSLEIYDINLKMVYKTTGNASKVAWNPALIKGNIFIYRLKVDGKLSSGKIIKIR